MNLWEMIVLIVAIGGIVSIVRARHGIREDAHGHPLAPSDPDLARLRDELRALKERVAVLERIATDTSGALDRQIEALRDR